MLNIVHCVTDEKFANNIVKLFDFLSDRCNSDYVYIKGRKSKKLQYIAENPNIEHLKIEELMQRLSIGRYDVLFLHNLRSLPLKYITHIPSNIKVVWLAWGFDIYSRVGAHPLIEVPNTYLPETSRLMKPTMGEMFTETCKRLYKLFIQDGIMRKAVSRIDYFSGVIPEEYDMMRKNTFFHAQPIEFRYSLPSLNISLDLLDTLEPVRGMDILVGNSGAATNNHVDIFKIISQVELGERKIYVPLSYSGTPRYRQTVKELGERLWGNRFVPLLDFLPAAQYRAIISSCGFRIFAHERQQAMGNVHIALRRGCKVFLSESSMTYRHQTGLGLKVYTIQHDLINGGLLELPSMEEAYKNMRISIEDTLTSKQVERLYKMITLLENS